MKKVNNSFVGKHISKFSKPKKRKKMQVKEEDYI